MKLNDEAVEAATQAAFKFHMGFNMDYRKRTAAPDKYVEYSQVTIINYLKNLDGEGLADLYEYWCERIEALPVPDKIRKGDLVACNTGMSQWRLHVCSCDLSPAPSDWRILRRAHQPRQWKIGDLVDDTRDLPRGAVLRDEDGVIAEHDGCGGFRVAGLTNAATLSYLLNPRIIWLPENGDES